MALLHITADKKDARDIVPTTLDELAEIMGKVGIESRTDRNFADAAKRAAKSMKKEKK